MFGSPARDGGLVDRNSPAKLLPHLPKLAYALHTHPLHYITEATRDFDALIRESLETIVRGPISEWSWLKASLPSTLGGINLGSTSLHAPAANVASSLSSDTLVSDLLGELVDHSAGLGLALAALSISASCLHGGMS